MFVETWGNYKTPEQYNLSNIEDLGKLAQWLSLEERKAFREKYQEEKDVLIYLTQEELQELKNTLEGQGLEGLSPQIQSGTIDGDVEKFISEQKLEWLSSSDLLWNVEWNIFTQEFLDTLDSEAEKILFEDKWIFAWLDISDTAKDHVSVSLTLALVENLKSNTNQLSTVVEELEKWGIDTVNSLLEQNNDQFAWVTEALQWYKWNGEQNAVFMDTATGKEFFSWILLWDIDADNILEKLESHESDTALKASIWDIEDIKNILSLSQVDKNTGWEEAPETQWRDTDTSWDTPPVSPEEAQSAIDTLKEQKPFGAFIAAILEVLKWIVAGWKEILWSQNTETTPKSQENKNTGWEVAPETPLSQVRNLLSQKIKDWSFWSISKASLESYIWDDTALQEILKIIEEIPNFNGQDTLEEKISNLFNTESGTSVNKFQSFIEDAGLENIQNSDNTLNSEKFIWALEAYKNYRVAYAQNPWLTYKDWSINNNE